MVGIHPTITYEAEIEQFLSENLILSGGVTVVTSTSNNKFAAKNLPIYGRKVIFG